MSKLKRVAWPFAFALGAAALIATQQAQAVSSQPFSDGLGHVAVSFDNHVIIYDGAAGLTMSVVEDIDVAGANGDLTFDNGLDLWVANTYIDQHRLVRLAEAAGHSASLLSTQDAPRALVVAGDGTLYVASPGGTIRRFAPNGSASGTFAVPADTSNCIGIDLAADQKTLFVVTGGRSVGIVGNADVAKIGPPGPAVPADTSTFTTLSGQGAACGIRLLPPERGSTESRHGGALVADGKEIKRLNRTGGVVGQGFKSATVNANHQNWIDVAVDPRMVYDANNPATGIDPNEYVFWGLNTVASNAQGSNLIARFRTDGGSNPLQSESTGSDMPRGIAVNGELRVAQVVRLLTLEAGMPPAHPARFLQNTPYEHTWSAVSSETASVAVMAFEVWSTDAANEFPDAFGRCAPSLYVNCRFYDHFGPAPLPTAIGYSRGGRSVVHRVAELAPLPQSPSVQVTITYPNAAPTGAGDQCAATPAVALLRDPYLPTTVLGQNGHDQFEQDMTNAFYDSDDGINGVPDIFFSDYVVVLRTDTLYASLLLKPAQDSNAQLGSSQPITLKVSELTSCQPVPGLEESLVLAVTDITSPVSKGTIVGDTETEGSLGAIGLQPWVFTDGEYRSNLAISSPAFVDGGKYRICVNAKASLNNAQPLFGNVCTTLNVVKGSGKKK